MSNTIVAQVATNDSNNTYFIQKNEQNSLKGVLWMGTGAALTTVSISLTISTIGLVGATALASAGILMNDQLRNSIGPVLCRLWQG